MRKFAAVAVAVVSLIALWAPFSITQLEEPVENCLVSIHLVQQHLEDGFDWKNKLKIQGDIHREFDISSLGISRKLDYESNRPRVLMSDYLANPSTIRIEINAGGRTSEKEGRDSGEFETDQISVACDSPQTTFIEHRLNLQGSGEETTPKPVDYEILVTSVPARSTPEDQRMVDNFDDVNKRLDSMETELERVNRKLESLTSDQTREVEEE